MLDPRMTRALGSQFGSRTGLQASRSPGAAGFSARNSAGIGAARGLPPRPHASPGAELDDSGRRVGRRAPRAARRVHHELGKTTGVDRLEPPRIGRIDPSPENPTDEFKREARKTSANRVKLQCGARVSQDTPRASAMDEEASATVLKERSAGSRLASRTDTANGSDPPLSSVSSPSALILCQ